MSARSRKPKDTKPESPHGESATYAEVLAAVQDDLNRWVKAGGKAVIKIVAFPETGMRDCIMVVLEHPTDSLGTELHTDGHHLTLAGKRVDE